mmetsp:Transcript_8927/g.32885  ORF Transcript_8927/g.32885 Transcript_8927/m.32885 type:complete len:124 (+) Transcript_8927:154-525(+)
MASSTGLQSVKHSLRLFFSNKYLYASVVRAMDQTVAATADTRSPEFQDYKSKHDMAAAKGVAKLLRERMRENDIHWVEFRKPKGKPYHGRLKAIVETMREEGVVFASSPPKSLMANGESGVGQ